MRAYLVAVPVVLGMLAACSPEAGTSTATSRPGVADATVVASQGAPMARAMPGIAALPDRGGLLEYRPLQTRQVRGATTWHPVALSETHALRAVVGGEMVVLAPDGRPIRLRYARHVEHPDGNWTWVGREPGAMPGTEAIITFGEKAVFGTIPDGDGPPLRLTTSGGRTWLVETDAAALALQHRGPSAPDFRLPPMLGGIPSSYTRTIAAAPSTAASTLAATNVIDLVIGYTSGFATRLGGQSQAVTRLTFMVDVANQTFANSNVDARIRVVRTLQVAYPDATPNDQALYEVTGVKCTDAGGGLNCEYVGPPAALQPLHAAREQFGGDLVSLVRKFSDPENGSCGVAWLNGAGQLGMSHEREITGFSVVSDSSGNRFPDPETNYICRDETLAHEMGHNMGSAHDRDTADGDDNTLQQEEYGAYSFSFGYRTSPGSGDFFTVMAYPEERMSPPFQVGYRVFSNPAISVCGGLPCGIANQADNARSLRLTLPVVVGFRATMVPDPQAGAQPPDFDGDGRSDVLWRNVANGQNAIWRSGNSATRLGIAPVANVAWKVVGTGDFNGDGKSDILWRNAVNGQNAIWRSGNSATPQAIAPIPNLAWKIVGTGDFNADGRDDILWRNDANGQNAIWRSGNSATPQAIAPIANLAWKIVGTGDFNGDGRSDILWRNSANGQNAIWRSWNAATPQGISSVGNLAWRIVGTGDFNGDGRSDVLWRNEANGQNAIWLSANAATPQGIAPVANLAWKVVG